MPAIEEFDPLDVVEARVAALEKRVFGDSGSDSAGDPTPVNVVDSLLKSQTMTSTAVSSRDKINRMAKRIDQLEEVLDPTYEDRLVAQGSRVDQILVMESEVREAIADLASLQEMRSVLESENIRNIPKLQERLDRLAADARSTEAAMRLQGGRVNDLVKCYNDVLTGFTKTFAQINEIVTKMEIEAAPKKVYD